MPTDFRHTWHIGQKGQRLPATMTAPTVLPTLSPSAGGLPIAVMTVALMLSPMCGVLVVGMAVCGTYLLYHTHGASLMVMMRKQAQQEQQGYGQEHAICGTGFFHAAKLAIYSCNRVAFTIVMCPRPCHAVHKLQTKTGWRPLTRGPGLSCISHI